MKYIATKEDVVRSVIYSGAIAGGAVGIYKGFKSGPDFFSVVESTVIGMAGGMCTAMLSPILAPAFLLVYIAHKITPSLR